MSDGLDLPANLRVPFNDLALQWRVVAAEVRRDAEELFERSAYCLGSFAESFEADVARWLGARHAVGVSSGTAALHLAAICAGIKPGDEVLVPAHTFIATVWGVLYAGGTPVLCDVDHDTGTIDLDAAAAKVTERTAAIIPVHLYGQPANMDGVLALAQSHKLAVVEDAAQSIGARWKGRTTGTLGAMGCVSFYPGKNLGAAGEAGLVVTDNDALAERLRRLRNHGKSRRYVHDEVGFNYRLDGFQAVVLRHKLSHLAHWTNERRRLAARYGEGLAGLPLDLPVVRHGDHVWHLYVVRVADRDGLQRHLAERAIETGLHYPVPLHRQPCLKGAVTDERFPCADDWAARGLSLPLFVGMTDAQQDKVIAETRAFFRDA